MRLLSGLIIARSPFESRRRTEVVDRNIRGICSMFSYTYIRSEFDIFKVERQRRFVNKR